MPGKAQPLFSNQPIVNSDGTPTLEFMRWAQQRQKDITESTDTDDVDTAIAKAFKGRKVGTTAPLTGGGTLDADLSLKLADTAVEPGTYGDSTHVVKFTVDEWGRITGAEEVAIAGGGGGATIVGMYQMPGANIPGNTSDTVYPGLTFTFTPPAAGLFRIEWFFFYFGGHRIRFSPRIDGAKIAGNSDDNWFSGGADERGAYKGVASIVQPLTAAEHTADLVYNVMDSTDGLTASYSYITVTPIAAAF